MSSVKWQDEELVRDKHLRAAIFIYQHKEIVSFQCVRLFTLNFMLGAE